jgi:hypothetical protein
VDADADEDGVVTAACCGGDAEQAPSAINPRSEAARYLT